MLLDGIAYGHVFCTSGARNIDGSGWWYDPLIPGKSWEGSTFVSRTITLDPNKGYMPLKSDGLRTREFFPRCIKPYWWIPAVLNAVSLSNPGLRAVLEKRFLQKLTEPFGLSFMAIAPTLEGRYDELEHFVDLLQSRLREFRAPFFIQLNLSCKNIESVERGDMLEEAVVSCGILGKLKRPVQIKVNALTDAKQLALLEKHPTCSSLATSNTIHWNDLGKIGIDVEKVFGTRTSPLEKFGGGSLSGPLLHPAVVAHIRQLRAAGFTKPILAEGGNFTAQHVDEVMRAGADAVGLGTVAMLRPWRLKGLIDDANLIVASHLTQRLARNHDYRCFNEEAA